MAEKKKKSKNGFWIQVLLMIVFLAGLLIMLYPFYVESINNFIDNRRIEEAQKLDAKRNAKELAKLRAENERAAKKAAKDPFRGTGNMNAKKLRKHLLGRVVIPKINVNVPLFNLTTADTLNYGAAVLQGSSFPTGGKGKRTVIAAHRGLPERKLFTDLDKVKKGDLLLEMDLEKIAAANHPAVVITVVTNTDDFKAVELAAAGTVEPGDELFKLSK